MRAKMQALTRGIGPSFNQCQLTYLDREGIDLPRAQAQHQAYEQALRNADCRVHRLEPEDSSPDAVFVEDTAVVLEEVAILTRPGASSRRAEVKSVAQALQSFRRSVSLEPPATLDGGDVLLLDRHLYVGLSSRTNEAALEQLTEIVDPLGYTVSGVAVEACLHLKTALTSLGDGIILCNPSWVDVALFSAETVVETDPTEPFAANALRIGDTLIYPSAFPKTRVKIEALGFSVNCIDISELSKAEAGVTCCSLVFEAE